MNHTPGPWATVCAMSSDTPHIRYITADGMLIASVRHRAEQTQDEALANARLIAAAPELLAALKVIAGESPCIDALLSDKEIARAAIAKAGGAA